MSPSSAPSTADCLSALRELAALLPLETRWWVCGGCALQLHVRRRWRPSPDLDVALVDAGALGRLASQLQAGVPNSSDRVRGTLPGGVRIDVTLSPGDASHWISRRDPAFRVPWSEALYADCNGVPYLAPELVLLSKGRRMAPVDRLDAAEVLPALEARQAARLAAGLPEFHPWALRPSGP